MVQQIFDFGKSTLDSSYSAICMFQDQSEKIGNVILNQASWVPEEGKKSIQSLVEAYKQGREEFKKNMDDGLKKAGDYLKGL